MPVKKTTAEFVAESQLLHGDKYDYSRVVYNGIKIKVSLVCRACNLAFLAWPGHHLAGQGCTKCWVYRRDGQHKKKTTESFVEAARKVHGDKFDYSHCEYKASQEKVAIRCLDCRLSFFQSPNSHLQGVGCPHCSAVEGARKRVAGRAAVFEERARKIHGDGYDYSAVRYVSSTSPIQITCRKCNNSFHQSPNGHLAGKGCAPCSLLRRAEARTYSTEEWIALAESTLTTSFDYSRVEYVGAHQHVTLGCRDCGRWFNRTPASHLHGHDCPFCSFGNGISKAETAWLDALSVPVRQHTITLPSGRRTRTDGYDPATKTVYAFLGSFWHADPRKLDPDEEHPVIGRLNKNIHAESLSTLRALERAGYRVVSIWEEDWKAKAH